MTSIVNRPRESPWRAVPMDEADECIRKVAWKMATEKVDVYNDGNIVLNGEEQEQRNRMNWKESLGRIIANPFIAPSDRPETHTSIKDGYAVRSSDEMADRQVVGVSTAGKVYDGEVSFQFSNGNIYFKIVQLKHGECVRISTGAVVPESADAVIQVEDTVIVEADGDTELRISIKTDIKKGQDIRYTTHFWVFDFVSFLRLPGSETHKGDVLIHAGCVLGSPELGPLGAFGHTKCIEVFKKPTISIFSTGNELVKPSFEGQLPMGAVRDSNSLQLESLFNEFNFRVQKSEILVDEWVAQYFTTRNQKFSDPRQLKKHCKLVKVMWLWQLAEWAWAKRTIWSTCWRKDSDWR